jgi:hypothetical protein
MLSVTKARYLGDYNILLSFNNGLSGTANLHDVIFNDKRPIFLPLRQENEFKNFKLGHDTIIWANELDLAPEFLFFITFKENKEFQEQFKEWGYID